MVSINSNVKFDVIHMAARTFESSWIGKIVTPLNVKKGLFINMTIEILACAIQKGMVLKADKALSQREKVWIHAGSSMAVLASLCLSNLVPSSLGMSFTKAIGGKLTPLNIFLLFLNRVGAYSFFSWALSYDHFLMLKIFINKESINVTNQSGMTPLLVACNYNNTKLAKWLVEHKADVNATDKFGNSPLLFVCAFNNTELAKWLLERNADVNRANNECGSTPLMLACSYNNTELAKCLVEHQADVNATNEYGNTPLMVACSHNNIELAKYLVEHQADLNAVNEYRSTPLMLACLDNNVELAKWLVEQGAVYNNVRDWLITKEELLSDTWDD